MFEHHIECNLVGRIVHGVSCGCGRCDDQYVHVGVGAPCLTAGRAPIQDEFLDLVRPLIVTTEQQGCGAVGAIATLSVRQGNQYAAFVMRTIPVTNINMAIPARTRRRRSLSCICGLTDAGQKANRTGARTATVSHDGSAHDGQRFVTGLYLAIVGVATLAGYIIGSLGIEGMNPVLFGIIQLPPTALGMALYGGITVGTLLGVLLVVMIVVSNRYADPDEGP